jgi:hypothetical protein
LFSVKKATMVLVFFGKYGGWYFSKYFPLANTSKKSFFKKNNFWYQHFKTIKKYIKK